jgi:hypothetical protein
MHLKQGQSLTLLCVLDKGKDQLFIQIRLYN